VELNGTARQPLPIWSAIQAGFLPDGLPVIGRVPGRDNAFVATGHGMLGVTLGPVIGRRLTEYVRTGRRPEALEPFRFDRLRH